MKLKKIRASALAVAILMMPFAYAASPDVKLQDLQGKEHHFSEYIGRGPELQSFMTSTKKNAPKCWGWR